MRPFLLSPLFAPLTELPGIGRRRAQRLRDLVGERIIDLLWHLPSGHIDRSYRPSIAEAEPGRIATLTLEVVAHHPAPRQNLPHKVRCRDHSGTIELLYFHTPARHLETLLPHAATRLVSGKVTLYRERPQIMHPDFILDDQKGEQLPALQATYPLTHGINQRTVIDALGVALKRVPPLPEWLKPETLKANTWDTFPGSLTRLHNPQILEDLDAQAPARLRLAYDELLAQSLALALIRAHRQKLTGRINYTQGSFSAQARQRLPFTLTDSQEQALKEIRSDLAAPSPMLRLLQGDVGCGKTIVAFLALLDAIESGGQGCLMVPTEILAQQHFKRLLPIATTLGLHIRTLTGKDTLQSRKHARAQLQNGQINLVIGTHALFQSDILFDNLALIVIDEQQRFGVHQRLALTEKGRRPDVLVMTATPIPRSLQMTAFGDLAISQIRQAPPGRLAIDTRLLPLTRLPQLIQATQRLLEAQKQIYWICPLVEESEHSDLSAVSARFGHLQGLWGDQVGLVHGRMSASDKDKAISDFAKGQCRLLVATTVVEVGVDVPQANTIIIEHAERFGLAQLHQLRGRVGRGHERASCILLYQKPLGEIAKKRLHTLRHNQDGFALAEIDLTLRGSGELLGTKQSGASLFRLAGISQQEKLLPGARKDAERILAQDPQLTSPRGQSLRLLLYLMRKDQATRLLNAG